MRVWELMQALAKMPAGAAVQVRLIGKLGDGLPNVPLEDVNLDPLDGQGEEWVVLTGGDPERYR